MWVPEEYCPSWLGMLAGTRARLDGFCCFDRGWPARHPRVGIKLPLSGTVVKHVLIPGFANFILANITYRWMENLMARKNCVLQSMYVCPLYGMYVFIYTYHYHHRLLLL